MVVKSTAKRRRHTILNSPLWVGLDFVGPEARDGVDDAAMNFRGGHVGVVVRIALGYAW